ncbi:MAG: hypothetical protein CEN90_668 [Parcubacteria group bacterium Licking1014_17]|nr:MAG: hypothetical protein CEN90_668 [Parcubacteria group bacterium Licking1014_17]
MVKRAGPQAAFVTERAWCPPAGSAGGRARSQGSANPRWGFARSEGARPLKTA